MGLFDVPIYMELKKNRVNAIINHYGGRWFSGKRILELGCGHADMGNEFYKLGSIVTVTDARLEHIEAVGVKYPYLERTVCDLNKEWPFRRDYDLILNMGILYHLTEFEQMLENCFSSCKNMFIESIVSDSNDPTFVKYIAEKGLDQSFTNMGCRPSEANIERIIRKSHFSFERYFSKDLNSPSNLFDWEPKNSCLSGYYADKNYFWLRRAWFCSK